jgi:hypothetical protein
MGLTDYYSVAFPPGFWGNFLWWAGAFISLAISHYVYVNDRTRTWGEIFRWLISTGFMLVGISMIMMWLLVWISSMDK